MWKNQDTVDNASLRSPRQLRDPHSDNTNKLAHATRFIYLCTIWVVVCATMEEACSTLLAAGFDEATVKIFRVNKVDRAILLDLDKDDMKELGVTALGDRKKLLSIIAKLKKETDSLTSKSVLIALHAICMT